MTKHQTQTWRVDGPDGAKWSLWDFGDEMTVQDGPDLLSNVVARIPQDIARRLTPGDKRHQMEGAAGAIHVARLLDSSSPNFRGLWRI